MGLPSGCGANQLPTKFSFTLLSVTQKSFHPLPLTFFMCDSLETSVANRPGYVNLGNTTVAAFSLAIFCLAFFESSLMLQLLKLENCWSRKKLVYTNIANN